MPKPRKPAGSRNCEKRIYILCEGADKHSEYAYLESLIKNTPIKGDKVQIDLAPTKYNTGRELVEEASKKIEKKFKEIDEAWVVYDQDGYTLHKDTFESAKQKNVKVAFSATSFEIWILLHYEYTTKQFDKSENIIKYLKEKNYIDYAKNSTNIYSLTKEKLENAKKNAKKIRIEVEKYDGDKKIYERNPYTNLDLLIEEIQNLETYKHNEAFWKDFYK